MDSTDDGFHSGIHNLTGDDENLRKSLQSKEQELKAICEQLSLDPSSFRKAVRDKLNLYSKTLMEKGITEVSRGGMMECYAREVQKQDDSKKLESDLYHLHTRYTHMLDTTHNMSALHKKAIKCLQNEAEKNKKDLEKIRPFFSRPKSDAEGNADNDHRTKLMKRAALAMKKLAAKKRKQQLPNGIPPLAKDDVLSELAAQTQELERLNGCLVELGIDDL